MTSREAVTVMIVDDHPVVRDGLRAILSTEPDLESVGEGLDRTRGAACSMLRSWSRTIRGEGDGRSASPMSPDSVTSS